MVDSRFERDLVVTDVSLGAIFRPCASAKTTQRTVTELRAGGSTTPSVTR
jgi:hypothetical protein